MPSWALADVAKADPRRRLEGLFVPGRYDVRPGLPAADVLRGLLETSATRLEASGLVAGAQSVDATPYQVLTISSLVEKEAITPGHGQGRAGDLQPARRRPPAGAGLDGQLPAGPAGAAHHRGRPGRARAVQQLRRRRPAADPDLAPRAGRRSRPRWRPEAGPWLYFVRCQTDGTSCFAETFAEHDANVEQALANGAF